MYAVEFQAIIENGILHIPKKYREVRFFIMYGDSDENKTIIKNQLDC